MFMNASFAAQIASKAPQNAKAKNVKKNKTPKKSEAKKDRGRAAAPKERGRAEAPKVDEKSSVSLSRRRRSRSRARSASVSRRAYENAIAEPVAVASKPTPGVKSCLKRTATPLLDYSDSSEATEPTAAWTGSDRSTDTNASSRSTTKSLSFGNIDIAEHVMILGDCPYCIGAPVAISDEVLRRTVVEVDQFDSVRTMYRRHQDDIRMSPVQRLNILIARGYDVDKISNVALINQKLQQQRMASLQNKRYDRFAAVAEAAGRTWKRMLLGASREEQELADAVLAARIRDDEGLDDEELSVSSSEL